MQKLLRPGQECTYQLEIQPDTTLTGFDLKVEYDARVCEFIEAKLEIQGIQVNSTIPGRLVLKAAGTNITQNTLLGVLNFKVKEGVSGKGYVLIHSGSTYTDSSGKTRKFAEGRGHIVAGKTFDFNKDGKIEADDFTLLAQKSGLTKGNPDYDEKFDLDGNDAIEKTDLDSVRDYLLTIDENAPQLSPIEQARFTEKFTNPSYEEETHTVIRITSYDYDKAGNLIKETNCNGHFTTYSYDAYNRLVAVTDSLGNTSQIVYDEVGNKLKEILPEKSSHTYSYDAMNRLLELRDTQNNILQKNSYDVNGLVIKTTDAKTGLSSGIEYSYDLGGRLQSIITPEAKLKGKLSAAYAYDALGNKAAYTDGENNTTRYQTDMWGKITKVIDPYNVHSVYTYDYAGNLVSTTDGNNNITQYIYNSLNQLAAIKDPLGQSITYEYDKEGRLIKEHDRNGQTLVYTYNSDNNLTSRRVMGTGEEEKFLYNKDGSLLGAIGLTGVDTFEYTPAGQLFKKLRNGQPVLTYEYNKNGSIKAVTDLTGQTAGYTYDDNGRLKTVLNGSKTLADYMYNSDNTLSGIQYANGININYDYDKDKNITSLIHKGPEGTINRFAYTYDNNGNQLSKTENGVVTAYSYDKLGRLQTAGNNTYTYDNAGNRKSWSGSHGMTTYNYDSRNRLVTVTDPLKGSIVYGYDNNGNQLTASNGTIYTYDGFNRLKTATMPNGSKTVNEYDALGLRTATIENGIRHDFVTDRGNIITEINAKNELVARNLRGLGLIAKEDKAGSLNYYLHNAHGDITNLVNEAGKVLNRYEYDAFGNTTSCIEQVFNRFRYAGEQFDNLTGQYYLRARYYNPLDGRFTQEDTYRRDGLNLYAYVRNNPIMYVDPSGHVTTTEGTLAHKIIQTYYGLEVSLLGLGNFAIEVPVEKYEYSKSGKGRIDMVLQNSMGIYELYEIKPDTYIDRQEGRNQLNGYLQAYKETYHIKNIQKGHTLNELSGVVLPFDSRRDMVVFSFDGDPGMIYYRLINNKKDTRIAGKNASSKGKNSKCNDDKNEQEDKEDQIAAAVRGWENLPDGVQQIIIDYLMLQAKQMERQQRFKSWLKDELTAIENEMKDMPIWGATSGGFIFAW